MENKLILFGLFYALLHATSTKGADPDSALDGGPLTIYIDAGEDIESLSSLAKTIEGKQSLIDDALKKISVTIEALEKRLTAAAKATEQRWNQRMTAKLKATEERWNQRMTTEAKATEERWSQRLSQDITTTEGRMSAEITRLNQKVVELSNQLATSRDVATPPKRPAELACEKITKDLQSIGEIKFSSAPFNNMKLYTSNHQSIFCHGILIDKRFFITAADCLGSGNYTKIRLDRRLLKGLKAVHIHPDFSLERAYLNNIALVELESDVDYAMNIYPMCLNTSQANPERDLEGFEFKIEIVADAECGTDLKPSQICATQEETFYVFSGMPIYLHHEKFPKYKLFGIVATDSYNFEPFVITKVFDYLDFIESIVWPKSGN